MLHHWRPLLRWRMTARLAPPRSHKRKLKTQSKKMEKSSQLPMLKRKRPKLKKPLTRRLLRRKTKMKRPRARSKLKTVPRRAMMKPLQTTVRRTCLPSPRSSIKRWKPVKRRRRVKVHLRHLHQRARSRKLRHHQHPTKRTPKQQLRRRKKP